MLAIVGAAQAQSGCGGGGGGDDAEDCAVQQSPDYDGWHGQMALAYRPERFGAPCVLLLDAERRSSKAFAWPKLSGFWNSWVALSPDGSAIAFSTILDPYDPYRVATASSAGTGLRAITPASGRSFDPVWDPDGRSIVFVGDPQVRPGFTVQRVQPDGSGLTALPVLSSSDRAALSPDGRRIAVVKGPAGAADPGGIAVSTIDGLESAQITVTPAGAAQYGPWWSPDGGSIAYIERRGPNEAVNAVPPYTFDIRVVGADGSGDRLVHQISMPDYLMDVYPVWSPDGTQIAANDGYSLIVVDVTGENLRTVIGPLDPGYGAPSWVQ